MLELFTERARQVVVQASDSARALGHEFIGAEHLLLGLIAESTAPAFGRCRVSGSRTRPSAASCWRGIRRARRRARGAAVHR